eukprot:COSAG01_NODE_1624_length_9704_cov_186.948777_15_plen_175_part_01
MSAMISALDEGIGDTVASLRASGLWPTTLMVAHTDNVRVRPWVPLAVRAHIPVHACRMPAAAAAAAAAGRGTAVRKRGQAWRTERKRWSGQQLPPAGGQIYGTNGHCSAAIALHAGSTPSHGQQHRCSVRRFGVCARVRAAACLPACLQLWEGGIRGHAFVSGGALPVARRGKRY